MGSDGVSDLEVVTPSQALTRKIYYNGVRLGDVQLAALNCLVVEAVQ